MLKALLIALGVQVAPLLLALAFTALADHMSRRRMENLPLSRRRELERRKGSAEQSRRRTLSSNLSAGYSDRRLVSAKLERKDKWGLNIDPPIIAPSWRTIYLILTVLSVVLVAIGVAGAGIIPIAIGALMAVVRLSLALSNGAKHKKAMADIYDKLIQTISGHMSVDSDADPKSIIQVSQWTLADEPQRIADAKVKAREDGEYDELEKDLPKPDRKSGKVKQPRIAAFRTTPLGMTIKLPVSFRSSAEDDMLSHLNEQFGATEWIAEREVKDDKGRTKTVTGWDLEHNVAYLKTVPPLPTRAMLPENFNEGPYNLIKLGVNVSGETVWDINSAPMALIPLAVDTPVWVRADGPDGGYEARRLDSVRPGDVVISGTGEDTRVVRTTPVHTPEDMYSLTFRDYDHPDWHGALFTVHAAGGHLWPVDAASTNAQYVAPDRGWDDSGEAISSRRMAEIAAAGHRVVLNPVYDGTRLIHWISYSVVAMKPEPVMCIEVEDESHTFLIAATHEEHAHAATVREASAAAIPTHNCGSPLTLDTRIPLYGGGTTTMGDVMPGDVLVGSGGRPTVVTAKSPVMTPERLYEVEFEEDADMTADDTDAGADATDDPDGGSDK